MSNGALIVFEGLDGSGKTTQLDIARRWLKDKGYKTFHTEWHASVEVKKALTKGGARRRMLSPVTANLVHAMDFADRYTWQIMPRLRRGYVVLADRYIYTALARGVVRGCKQSWLQAVYEFACAPLTTFYFRVTPEVSLERILRDRISMKFFESGMDLNFSSDVEESFLQFQGSVMEQYDELAINYDFITLDGAAEQKEISEKVKNTLRTLAAQGKLPTLADEKKKKKVKA